MTDNGLRRCWVIGDVTYHNGTASVIVAKTKTAARQWAERRLLRAEERAPTATKVAFDREHYAKFDVVGDTDIDFAHAFVARWKRVGHGDVYTYEELILRHDGVRLTGPNGESIVVTEPSTAARREHETRRRVQERRERAFMQSAAQALQKGGER